VKEARAFLRILTPQVEWQGPGFSTADGLGFTRMDGLGPDNVEKSSRSIERGTGAPMPPKIRLFALRVSMIYVLPGIFPCYTVDIPQLEAINRAMARSSTTYPRKWVSKETTVIRVPAAIAVDLLAIARRMDTAKSVQIHDDADTLVLEFTQNGRRRYSSSEPINVASVPHRSPFRYPGGKTWLIPHIRDWLCSAPKKPLRLIEPFAGGGIVSLTSAFEKLAKHVIFSELDANVAAVWRVVLNGQAEWLAQRIENFNLSNENVALVLSAVSTDLKDLAFQTIIRNRVQRGGILAPGAGLVKNGENGKGLGSRWYPTTLSRRIREINRMKDRITFIEGDAFDLIEEHQNDSEAFFYIDPPYTQAAKRLYSKWSVDHQRLFRLMRDCKGEVLMSYDNTAEVVHLAERHGFQIKPVAMKNTHHAKMTELLIGKDLSWFDSV
jgi:DNA adenine methylase